MHAWNLEHNAIGWIGEPITASYALYIISKHITSTQFCTELYPENTMQGNTSSNVSSDIDEDLLDSMPRLEATTADGSFVMTWVVVGAIAVVGNMHVLTVFVKNNRLFENINTTFIANQSVIDSIASFIILMNGIYTRQLDTGVSATLLCKLWMTRTLMWGLMESSTFNLMAISFERYLAVVHPVWHKAYFTNSKASIVAVLIWFCGVSSVASIMIPSTGVLREGCMVTGFWPWRKMAQIVGFVHIFVNLVMPVFLHSFCYARIASALRKRISRVTPKDDTTSTTLRGKTGKTSVTTRTTEAGAIHSLGDDADTTLGAVSLPSTSGANVITNQAYCDSTELALRSSNKQPDSMEIPNDKAKGTLWKHWQLLPRVISSVGCPTRYILYCIYWELYLRSAHSITPLLFWLSLIVVSAR